MRTRPTTPPRARAPGARASALPKPRLRALPDEGSRERIHAAARSLFSRYGYEGVSLQLIADEVGLHKSSLFHHYSSKLSLLKEVLEATVERVLDCVRPLQGDDPPKLPTVLRAMDALVDQFSDDPDAARLLLATLSAPYDSDLRRVASEVRALEFYETLDA